MFFRSGIEEEYTEKDQLCQDIYDTMALFRVKEKKKIPKKKSQNLGKTSRDHWANNLCEGETIMELIVDSEPINTLSTDHNYCSKSYLLPTIKNSINI